MRSTLNTDILIVGGGIIGLTIGRELSARSPATSITLIEKEPSVGAHASGRNSGVLHAGFYYSPDSLKARFTVEGNRLLTDYCKQHQLKINQCGKVVVAKDDKEIELLYELKSRAEKNGVALQLVDEAELAKIEPNARTRRAALFSPSTATVNPKEVVAHIAESLKEKVSILLNERLERRTDDTTVDTTSRRIRFKYLVNTAGLYADKIAQQFAVGRQYTVVPFKGLYMQYSDNSLIGKHIYPVPDLRMPFLGVHFTKTVDGRVKIGPTAIPAFWRENYRGMDNFRFSEFLATVSSEAGLFISNRSNFRALAFEEMKKYSGTYLKDQAALLVKQIDTRRFGDFLQPGIRAQLVDTTKGTLVMDFVVEHGERSTHVLNAVSPAFTCSFAFSRFVVDEIEKRWVR